MGIYYRNLVMEKIRREHMTWECGLTCNRDEIETEKMLDNQKQKVNNMAADGFSPSQEAFC